MPRISGTLGVKNRLARAADLEKVGAVSRALYAGGDIVRAEASISITRGSVSGKNHVPSLPGQPPSNDTGVLRINIEVTQPAPLRVVISSNAPYAAALERGTSRMAARPYMGPALRASKKEIVALVRNAVRQSTRKGK